MIGAERVATHADVFEIRSRADLGRDRLIYRARIYGVTGVIEQGRRQGLF